MVRSWPIRVSVVGLLMLVAEATLADSSATQPARNADQIWKFDETHRWNGWQPNGQVVDVRFDSESVLFQTRGSDPIIIGPIIEWTGTSNGQHIEIDIDCEAPAEGEFYYTNTTEGPYGGFNSKWCVPVAVPTSGRQIVPVWPFWETLGRVIRIRFDPPSGTRCRLYGIRIVGNETVPGTPSWTFTGATSWQSMYAAKLEPSRSGLHVQALRPMALIATGVEPFEADRRSVLRLDAECPGEHTLCFYWASRQETGLWGEPIELSTPPGQPISIDLRQYPEWKGTITNLAIGFGTNGHESLTLRSLAIEENAPDRPLVRVRCFGYAAGVGRPDQAVEIRAILEHAAGPSLTAGTATLQTDDNSSCADPTRLFASMATGDRIELRWKITPRVAGQTRIILLLNNQKFARTLRIEPATGEIARDGYEVPPPRPVSSDYRIGIYYFPGWSGDQMTRWHKQADLPERDPLLGWYDESRPEVADWYIKWAVENGLSFFVYDWYWRDGREQLGGGLNDGFLKARYNSMIKFAIMWANHKPFASHTREQLLAVTDYWIEHYLRRPNYLTVDGKPYVSFFCPNELLTDLGSAEKVHEVLDAMRERAKAAGLPGLHFGAIEAPGQITGPELEKAGFDSFTAYTYIRTGTTVSHSLYRQYLAGYRTKWEKARQSSGLSYIPVMGVGWDGPVWYGPRSERRRGRRSADFEEGLGRLKAYLDETGGRMALLEAWNELGEGSYIEPNVEFGFTDLEAIRKVFAKPGKWAVNISPQDVGLAGRYDMRQESGGCHAAQRFGKVVELSGVCPAVTRGLAIRCWENRIFLEEGEVRLGEQVLQIVGDCLTVEPAQTRKIELPMSLNAEEIKTWLGGNRLIISGDDRRNLLPGSYLPGSLRLTGSVSPWTLFEPKRDYALDDTWGAFAITADGRLKTGQQATARYEMSLRRIDSLILDKKGRPQLIAGTPLPDCPKPPVIPQESLHLANIYRPFGATTVEPHHVYVMTEARPDLSPIRDARTLEPVRAKLRDGQAVTIVCWGDSVTVGGDATLPAKTYVRLFETMLKERYPKANIRIINAGIGGSSTPGRLPNFQAEVLDHHPDLVTLEFINDMGVPQDRLTALYAEILQRTRQAGAALLIMTPHFAMPAWMNLPNGRGVDPRPVVKFLRRFTAENQLPLADASRRWDLLEKMGIPYETLLRNGINHPDDDGHRIFAEELMRFFP